MPRYMPTRFRRSRRHFSGLPALTRMSPRGSGRTGPVGRDGAGATQQASVANHVGAADLPGDRTGNPLLPPSTSVQPLVHLALVVVQLLLASLAIAGRYVLP